MSQTEARLEFLLPDEIRGRLADRSVVYLPLGTIEWHCEHLPVGLDGLTAHGVCLGAATQDGGVVYPTLYFGTGGGHSLYPWTVMMDSEREIGGEIEKALGRLQDFGVRLAVLFSGHFAPGQLSMIDEIAQGWIASGRSMKVIATAVNRIEGLPFGPDHAGVFETTLLGGLWPDRVQINRLPSVETAPLAPDDVWEAGRHDPKHPLWGVIGADPRNYDAHQGPPLVAACTKWLIDRVQTELSGA
jgi:creatinine amidohydrolase